MKNKKLSFNNENVSSVISNKGPTYFRIADSALTLFNQSVPLLAEMSVCLLKLNGEFKFKVLTETLNTFNITTSAFIEFLSQNENLDFPLTQYEKLKKDSMYNLIITIEESPDKSFSQKLEELEKLWAIIDESNEKKRESDYKCMLKSYGIKTAAFSTTLLVGATFTKIIIKAATTNHTKVAIAAEKTARTAMRLKVFKSFFKL